MSFAYSNRISTKLAAALLLAVGCSSAAARQKEDSSAFIGLPRCSATFMSGESIPSGKRFGQKIVENGSRFEVSLINILLLKGTCVDEFTTGQRNTFVLGGSRGYWVDRQTNQISRHDNALSLHDPVRDKLTSQTFNGSPNAQMLILSGDLFLGVVPTDHEWQINVFIREANAALRDTSVADAREVKLVESEQPVLSLAYGPQMERAGGTLAIATKVNRNLIAIQTYHVTRSN